MKLPGTLREIQELIGVSDMSELIAQSVGGDDTIDIIQDNLDGALDDPDDYEDDNPYKIMVQAGITVENFPWAELDSVKADFIYFIKQINLLNILKPENHGI